MSRHVKPIAVALFCAAALFLAGCHKQTTSPPVTTDFSCDFSARYGDMQVKGTLTRYHQKTLQLAFSYPTTLQDVVVIWDDGTVKVTYHDMTFEINPSALPESALGEAVVWVLDEIANGNGNATERDGVVTVSGSQDRVEYVYTYDAKSGKPLSLSVPTYDLEVTFADKQA